MGCAATPVAGNAGGLLPRLFTLALPQGGRAVVFCHIHRNVATTFPLESMMPCVARTFLAPRGATDHISAVKLLLLTDSPGHKCQNDVGHCIFIYP